jgi:hypothetical protein
MMGIERMLRARHATRLLSALLVTAAWATRALAGPQDYAFEAATPEVRKGEDAVVAVRLVHKPTGQPVPDAVIFQTRLDMAPDGMPTMTTPVTPLPSTEPGVYPFQTDLVMAGGWRLTLQAKVQGEPATVSGEVLLRATP